MNKKIIAFLITISLAAISFSVTAAAPLDLAKKSGCFACHAIDKKVVGPSWGDVSKRYKGQDVRGDLIAKVKIGGKGNWTEVTKGVPMPPYSPRVKDEDIETLVDFILALEK